MIVLGIDTSSVVGSVAISRDGEPIARKTISVDMEHSGNILPATEALLSTAGMELRDVVAVGVGVGPGSYTGVRVGIAFSKGLAYGLKIPVIGVCSFESMIYNHRDFAGAICTLEDAKMGGVYWALYKWTDGGIHTLQPPKVTPTEGINVETGGNILFLSPDIEKFMGELSAKYNGRAAFKEDFPDASYVAVIAGQRHIDHDKHPGEKLEPYYLRPTMAEMTWARKHRKP